MHLSHALNWHYHSADCPCLAISVECSVPADCSNALQVISVVGSSASQQQDSHSHQVAAATLAALVPAWLQADKPLAELTAAVVTPLPKMLPHTRLPLLTAYLNAVPQVGPHCFPC